MPVILVSNDPCCHQPTSKKAFCSLQDDTTMLELVRQYHPEPTENIKVVCGSGPILGLEVASISYDELQNCCIGNLAANFRVNHIKIVCDDKNDTSCEMESSSSTAKRSAFDVLMSASRKRGLPEKKSQSSGLKEGISKKDAIFNSLVDDLKVRNCSFPQSLIEDEGKYIIQTLVNALWYITNQHAVIEDTSSKRPGVVPVPPCWGNYQGYNDHKRKKTKEQPMYSSILKGHSDSLYALSLRPTMESTQQLKTLAEDINKLAKCMQQYAEYLDVQRKAEKERSSLLHPIRMLADNVNVQHRNAVSAPKDCYKALDEAVKHAPPLEPLSISDFMPEFRSGTERFRFFENLHLSFPVDMLKYAPGGSYMALGFVWNVAEERTPEQQQTQTVQTYEQLRSKLPQFHTRAMKAAFKVEFSHLSKVTPSVVESVYQRLTLDSSAHANPAANERIRLILLGETGLIEDLRTHNAGRPNTKYDLFFEHMGTEIDEVMAADDRRHGEAHLAHWISLTDLIKKVAGKCPQGTAIPSKDLVRIQFTPKNPYTHSALQFTSRFPVQYKIQVRQLRASHPDNHFVAALLLYLKHFVILLGKAICCLMFCDDKAKVPFGEPGHVLSTGVRGRSSLAPTTSNYMAEDHDIHRKGSLTPSVYLESEIPESAKASFYRGQIHVSVNDSALQQSKPLRHGAAIVQLLRNRPGGAPPVFTKFSDGGTDQRITLEHVKCSLIAVFKLLDLDLLVACRCAPGQSWINLAERCMSLLNLGLQNCALQRDSCTQETEKKLKTLGGVAAIREAGASDPELAAEWKDAVKPIQAVIEKRFQRLTLKGKPVSTFSPVGDEVIGELEKILLKMFPSININKLTKQGLKGNDTYKRWMVSHCIERTYSFQIRKCKNLSCCPEPCLGRDQLDNIGQLPDPVLDETGNHFLKFDAVYGKASLHAATGPPSAEPVLKTKTKGKQVKKPPEQIVELDPVPLVKDASICTLQNARSSTTCIECSKPRLLYSKHTLTDRQQTSLALLLSEFDYSCGSPVTHPRHSLHGVVFARLPIHCGDPVEVAYYKTGFGPVDVCCFCAQNGAHTDQGLLQKYKTVLPICDACKTRGRLPVVFRPYGKGT